MNDRLISSMNYATEETLLIREKPRLHQPWNDDVILKDLYHLKDQQIAQNANSNELSKSQKRIKLGANFLKK